ncbi:MAG: hypothetical protein Q8859_04745 [Bacteroidota bacterium]|nr:hypothetical protein [Bacteroidota bacterium]
MIYSIELKPKDYSGLSELNTNTHPLSALSHSEETLTMLKSDIIVHSYPNSLKQDHTNQFMQNGTEQISVLLLFSTKKHCVSDAE